MWVYVGWVVDCICRVCYFWFVDMVGWVLCLRVWLAVLCVVGGGLLLRFVCICVLGGFCLILLVLVLADVLCLCYC